MGILLTWHPDCKLFINTLFVTITGMALVLPVMHSRDIPQLEHAPYVVLGHLPIRQYDTARSRGSGPRHHWGWIANSIAIQLRATTELQCDVFLLSDVVPLGRSCKSQTWYLIKITEWRSKVLQNAKLCQILEN